MIRSFTFSKMQKHIFIFAALISEILFFQSWKNDKAETNADHALYEEATAGGFTYYQTGDLLAPASPSPHGNFKLRFNPTAQAALDGTGELPENNAFPTGSILVKEIFSGTNIILYAVMKKDPSNSNAGSGWLWAEFNPDGSASFSSSKKGDGCIGCHSGTPNRDLVRTFDLH